MHLRTHCKKTHRAQDLCDTPAGDRAGHSAYTSRDARSSSDRDLPTSQHSAEGWRRGQEPTQLWKARKWADIWQITRSRVVRHVVIGTFSSAKQSYFCLTEDYSLQTKMLNNLVSLKKKKKGFFTCLGKLSLLPCKITIQTGGKV